MDMGRLAGFLFNLQSFEEVMHGAEAIVNVLLLFQNTDGVFEGEKLLRLCFSKQPLFFCLEFKNSPLVGIVQVFVNALFLVQIPHLLCTMLTKAKAVTRSTA